MKKKKKLPKVLLKELFHEQLENLLFELSQWQIDQEKKQHVWHQHQIEKYDQLQHLFLVFEK